MKVKLILRLLGPIIFLIILYFYVDFDQLKEILFGQKWIYFSASVLTFPVLVLMRSNRWQNILNNYSIPYSKWQCFKIYFVEMVIIMVVSTIGTFVKVVYLKRDGHGLLNPLLSIISDKYYDYVLPLVFGLISALLLSLGHTSNISLIIILIVLLIIFKPLKMGFAILIQWITPKRFRSIFLNKKWDFNDHMEKLKTNLGGKAYLYSIGSFGAYYLTVYFLNRGMNINLSFTQVVLIMALTALVAMIPLSFFGIGTRDIGLLIVFQWFNRTPEEAVALSMALLLHRVSIVMIGAIFWFMDPPPLIMINAPE